MPRSLSRAIPASLCLLVLGQSRAGAQTKANDSADLPKWDRTYELRFWSGYKDNVLLGRSATQSSPLVGGGADIMFFRLPENGWEGFVLGTGDYSRFLTTQRVDHEATAVLEGQIKKDFGNSWTLGGTAEYLYFDQVFDVSSIYRQFTTLPVQGHSLSARPTLRRDLPGHFWAELQFGAERQFYQKTLDDFWENGPALVLGRNYGNRSEISLSYEVRKRDYDTRARLDAHGNSLGGPNLSVLEHEVLLNWRHYWDTARRWQTTTRVGLEKDVDNGGGFWDFWRYQLGGQIRFRGKKWEIKADSRLYYYHYDVQTITTPFSPKRHKTMVDASLRAERKLSRSLKIFSSYEYERSLSNLGFDQYESNTVEAGLDWEF